MKGAFCQVKFVPYSPPQAGAGKKMNLNMDTNSKAVAGAGSDGVGRLVDTSQADDRRMIQLVRDRPLLYARNNMPVASFHTNVKRLWKEVAEEMGWTVADVRRKWSHIRNSYSRHLRNEIHGAITSKGRTVSRWYLADELEFLRQHMATDTRSSPYNSTYAPSTFLELDMSESQGESDVKPFLQNPWLALGQPRHDPAQSAHDESSSSAVDPEETSSYFQFFRGLHPDYQELSPRKQRQFKRQCLLFLHQLLDEEDRKGVSSEEAMNLTNSQTSDDDDRKPCVVAAVGSVAAAGAIIPD